MEVKLGSWSSVAPSPAVKDIVAPLSPLDNFFIYAAYQKKVLFFRNPGECDAAAVLKESLAKTLHHFHPLAGRISFKTPEIQLQLHSNGAGAAFAEATTLATLADLGDAILPSELTDKLCQTEVIPPYPWNEQYPLLSIQLTKFSCGGLSLGITFSHQICDGVGFWYFVNSWAETARLGAPLVLPSLSYEIEEDRQLFPGRLPPGTVQMLRRTVFQIIRSTGWKTLKDSGLRSTRFELSKAKLNELKSLAPGCTTFDVTVSHLWKRVAAAWQCDGSGTTVLMSLVNCRGRTSWISSNYFGNAVVLTSVSVKIAQLRNETLAQTARRIHDRVAQSCSRESIEEEIRLKHLYDNNEDFTTFSDVSSASQIVAVIGSPRHRIYDIDFGWGRVCDSTFGAQDLGPNKIYLFPSAHDEGGIDVTVALTDRCMRLFLNQSKE